MCLSQFHGVKVIGHCSSMLPGVFDGLWINSEPWIFEKKHWIEWNLGLLFCQIPMRMEFSGLLWIILIIGHVFQGIAWVTIIHIVHVLMIDENCHLQVPRNQAYMVMTFKFLILLHLSYMLFVGSRFYSSYYGSMKLPLTILWMPPYWSRWDVGIPV